MKKKIFNIIVIIICSFILFFLLLKKNIVYSSIFSSLNIWYSNLLPSIFPFLIISNILINYNICDYIPKFIKNKCKQLFNISDGLLEIFIISILSGFPSNARITRIFYDKGIITRNECNHILIFNHFANPVFIVNVVGVIFLRSYTLGIIILFSHYVGNIILGLLCRNSFNQSIINVNSSIKKNISFGNIFISSIKNAIDNILLICGILVLFTLISSIFNYIFNMNLYTSSIFNGIFELTNGIQSITRLALNDTYKCIISTCFLSFGGFSIHMQVMSQLLDCNISYYSYLIARLLHMIISGTISFLLCFIII